MKETGKSLSRGTYIKNLQTKPQNNAVVQNYISSASVKRSETYEKIQSLIQHHKEAKLEISTQLNSGLFNLTEQAVLAQEYDDRSRFVEDLENLLP